MLSGNIELYNGIFFRPQFSRWIRRSRDGMYHTDSQFPVQGDIATCCNTETYKSDKMAYTSMHFLPVHVFNSLSVIGIDIVNVIKSKR